jgi:methylenetetrahydrofolate dehydrogenase (NADP+)/methenyltetrahydrofolate cyclohydrolase
VSADLIDGKAFAERLRGKVAEAVPAFVGSEGRKPGLAVVLVGDDPASQVYVRSKGKATLEAGMESFEHRLPNTASQQELVALVEQLNGDERVDGILVQLPLPPGVDDKRDRDDRPSKDVDGFHVSNAGRLAVGEAGLVPCTPLGALMLLKDRLGDLSGP